MSTSLARVEANQRNALKSTGPRTLEGKEASRRNALKHAMTGNGIVVPSADLAAIARVAADLRDYYGPTDPVGLAMTDHAATLIVRLKRCGQHEVALIEDQVAAAKYDFDQGRRDWADELFDGLLDTPASVIELRRFPEGIDRMIEGWMVLQSLGDWSEEETRVAVILADTGCNDPSAIRSSIPHRVTQLAILKEAIDRRPIDRGRQHAAELALFGMSPEAVLARRYEAATVRALEKARAYLEDTAMLGSIPEAVEAPEQIDPASPLGSFLPGQPPRPELKPSTRPGPSPVAPEPPVDRSKRPDPSKLRAMMDRKRS